MITMQILLPASDLNTLSLKFLGGCGPVISDHTVPVARNREQSAELTAGACPLLFVLLSRHSTMCSAP